MVEVENNFFEVILHVHVYGYKLELLCVLSLDFVRFSSTSMLLVYYNLQGYNLGLLYIVAVPYQSIGK